MKKTLLSAVAAVGIAAGAITIMSGAAQALSFDYYFTNTVGNVSGTVTGHVDGLADNSTGAASAVWVDSYPAALGSYSTPFDVLTWTGGTIGESAFTVTGGVLTQVLFDITGANGINDQLYLNSDCVCAYGTGHTNFLDIGSGDSLFVWNVGDLNAPDGLVIGTFSAVPEASTWAMMLLGFASLGFAGYRKTKSGLSALSAA